jgi:hypothetical protein
LVVPNRANIMSDCRNPPENIAYKSMVFEDLYKNIQYMKNIITIVPIQRYKKYFLVGEFWYKLLLVLLM